MKNIDNILTIQNHQEFQKHYYLEFDDIRDGIITYLQVLSEIELEEIRKNTVLMISINCDKNKFDDLHGVEPYFFDYAVPHFLDKQYLEFINYKEFKKYFNNKNISKTFLHLAIRIYDKNHLNEAFLEYLDSIFNKTMKLKEFSLKNKKKYIENPNLMLDRTGKIQSIICRRNRTEKNTSYHPFIEIK